MGTTFRRIELGGICVFVVVFWMAQPAAAAITRTSGTIATTVQELIDSAPASVSSDRQTLGVDSQDFPLRVSGSLTSTDLNGALMSLGQGFGEFADPARLDQANPEELAVEVACYSNTGLVSYSVQSSAEETRTLVFSNSELGFVLGASKIVESRVFLSGAVIFWSTQPNRTLDEMLAELSLTVTRDDTDSTLFETSLEITGTNDAGTSVATSGPIRSTVVSLEELADEGADPEAIAILRQVRDGGALIIALIGPQEHVYQYTVTPDDAFDLTATLRARVRNIPDGTGVAAVMGRPFADLAEFIERGLPGLDGEAVQKSLNDATAKRSIGLVTQENPKAQRDTRTMCGALGVEAIGLLMLGLLLVPGRGRSFRAACQPRCHKPGRGPSAR